MKLIDADALMEAIEIRMKSKEDDFKAVSELMAINRYIAQASPVKKQDREWIPVTERLPEEPKNPIDKEEGAYDLPNLTEYNVTIADAQEATTLYYAGGDVWIDNCGNYYHVIAWMQLPEMYKAD